MSRSSGTERAAGETSPHALPSLGVIIVAAGRGDRLGLGTPKAFVEIDGRPLLEYALRTAAALPGPGQIVLVAPEGYAAQTLEIVEATIPSASSWQVSVESGGRERHESVRNGLAALHDSISLVLVHDAARPLTPTAVFERVIAEVRRTGDGVIPTVPVTDTLKRVDADGVVISTEDRAALSAVQTPQGFVRERLAAAHESAQLQEGDGSVTDNTATNTATDTPTDDAEVLQRFGGKVRTVAGDPRAHKITTQADLLMLSGLLRGDSVGDGVDTARATHTSPTTATTRDRSGS